MLESSKIFINTEQSGLKKAVLIIKLTQFTGTSALRAHPYGYSLWPLFVTLRVLDSQVNVISATEIFSLLICFALVLQTKFSTEINKKDKKCSPKFCCFSLALFNAVFQFIKSRTTAVIKTFCFILSNIFFCVSTITKSTKDKYRTIVVKEHCFAVSTYIYFQLLDI